MPVRLTKVEIDKLRHKSKLIKDTVDLVSSRACLPSSRMARSSVNATLKETHNSGKKLMKLGAALILMPEPVTSIAGVPILLAGKAISSKGSTNIKGVYEELNQALKAIST